MSLPITTRSFPFHKDERGTWIISFPHDTPISSTNHSASNSDTFLTIVAHPPATAHHDRHGSSTTRGPKSMTIYAGAAPESARPLHSSCSSQTEKSASALDSADPGLAHGHDLPTDVDGTTATSRTSRTTQNDRGASVTGNIIGTVKCHETLSLKSDVVLNSLACSMDRGFTSTTGLGRLEWRSDLAAAKEKRTAGELRSILCLLPAEKSGTADRSGRVVCRVLREEVVGGGTGTAAGAGEKPMIDEKSCLTEVEVEEKQQQQILGRHTWKFTHGLIEVSSIDHDSKAMTEGQIQELLTSAVVEIERRARMQSYGGGTKIGTLASAAMKAFAGH